jgi:hypothetical protein
VKFQRLDDAQELGRPDVLCDALSGVEVKLELGEEITRSYGSRGCCGGRHITIVITTCRVLLQDEIQFFDWVVKIKTAVDEVGTVWCEKLVKLNLFKNLYTGFTNKINFILSKFLFF